MIRPVVMHASETWTLITKQQNSVLEEKFTDISAAQSENKIRRASEPTALVQMFGGDNIVTSIKPTRARGSREKKEWNKSQEKVDSCWLCQTLLRQKNGVK